MVTVRVGNVCARALGEMASAANVARAVRRVSMRLARERWRVKFMSEREIGQKSIFSASTAYRSLPRLRGGAGGKPQMHAQAASPLSGSPPQAGERAHAPCLAKRLLLLLPRLLRHAHRPAHDVVLEPVVADLVLGAAHAAAHRDAGDVHGLG